MKPAAVVFGAIFIAAGLAACAGAIPDRFTAASANTRSSQPLVEWVDVLPEHIADIDPGRLKGEGTALIIARVLRENSSGERTGTTHFLLLRDVSTSTIRSSPIQRTGTEADVGWLVMFVPPGQYAVNRGGTRKTTTIRNGKASVVHVDTKGHPFVPLSATTRINSGDVVYVGTVVYQASSATAAISKVFIRDERAAAARWSQAHIPNFAPHMQTKLLPPPVKPLIN